jgi:type III pantothenate kinase
MLLAIDIGNTNITFGIFKGNSIIKKFDIPTKNYCLKALKKSLSQKKLNDAIICSVVPKTTAALQTDLRRILGKKPTIIGKEVQVPIKNLYRRPGQVGQDRLVNAYAAVNLYGAPSIVVDFGTAITFDVISKKREYLGGMILPGLRISLDALFRNTALLPKINLEKPAEFIGRDTKNSMLSGIVYGFAALTDDLAQRIKGKIGSNAKVISTGGNVSIIARFCRGIDRLDIDLTLKGLNMIWLERQGGRYEI